MPQEENRRQSNRHAVEASLISRFCILISLLSFLAQSQTCHENRPRTCHAEPRFYGMSYAGSLCWPARFLLYDPAAQATRKGWPYYIRAARAACGGVVSRRATPGGWPALSTCDGEPAYGMPCRYISTIYL